MGGKAIIPVWSRKMDSDEVTTETELAKSEAVKALEPKVHSVVLDDAVPIRDSAG